LIQGELGLEPRTLRFFYHKFAWFSKSVIQETNINFIHMIGHKQYPSKIHEKGATMFLYIFNIFVCMGRFDIYLLPIQEALFVA
jgi:hypothetical protein